MFERFTWELRAKLLSAHQTVRITQSSRARGRDYDSAASRTSPTWPASSTTPHQRPIPAPSPPHRVAGQPASPTRARPTASPASPRRRPKPAPPRRRPKPAPPRRRPARVADPSPPQAPVSTAVCPNRRPPRLKHPMPISTEVDCTLSTHPTIEGESKETTMHLRSAPLRSTHTQLRTGITARAGNWLVARNEANS